jgi:hypothetical protein
MPAGHPYFATCCILTIDRLFEVTFLFTAKNSFPFLNANIKLQSDDILKNNSSTYNLQIRFVTTFTHVIGLRVQLLQTRTVMYCGRKYRPTVNKF